MLIVNGIDTVLLHMPKCAGSSVRWAVIDKYPDYRYSCEHAPITSLPQKYKDFKRIGFCRNPLTWYVSKFNYISRIKGHASIVVVLSDSFKLSFQQTLPRLLNLREFLTNNPGYLYLFKKQIQRVVMNKYICHLALSYDDVYNLTADYFPNTLYDYWYMHVGLNTATVYKMDDENFSNNVLSEFPGANIGHRNACTGKNYTELYTPELAKMVFDSDNYYFTKYNYTNLGLF